MVVSASGGAVAFTGGVAVMGVIEATAAGEDAGAAAGDWASASVLAGVSAGIHFGIGQRTGIAHGGATTILPISIRIPTRTMGVASAQG